MASSSSRAQYQLPALAQWADRPCPYPGCRTVLQTDRQVKFHSNIAHRNVWPFVCPAPDCLYYEFDRDKMMKHLNKHHAVTFPPLKDAGGSRTDHWELCREYLKQWLAQESISDPDTSLFSRILLGTSTMPDEWYGKFKNAKYMHFFLIDQAYAFKSEERQCSWDKILSITSTLPDHADFKAFCAKRGNFTRYSPYNAIRVNEMCRDALYSWLANYPKVGGCSLLEYIMAKLLFFEAERSRNGLISLELPLGV